MLLLRRREMMVTKDSSTLNNYQTEYGKFYDRWGNLHDIPIYNSYQTAAILDYFPAQPKDVITFLFGRPGSIGGVEVCLIEYDENKSFVDYWVSSGASPRTITLSQTSHFIRGSITYGETDESGVLVAKGYEENAFIRNDTTGVYYYKGKNVQ